MKYLIFLILSVTALLTSACAKSESTPDRTVVSEDLAIDCSNIENNLVDGLPSTMGQTPSTPNAVQNGIIYYRQLSANGDQNSAFYTKNADLMEQRLNEFNVRFISECK